MWYQGASFIEILGVLLICTLFIVIGIGNLKPYKVKDHIDRARAAHTPFPEAVFWIGICLEFGSCALILTSWHPDWGVIGLLIFMVFATGIFLRYWEVEDPMMRNLTRNAFFQNVGITGGLLVLLQRFS